MEKYQTIFEHILKKKINKHMFKILYENAKFDSYLNKISIEDWEYFLELNLETNGCFIEAVEYLYSELSQEKNKATGKYYLNINNLLNDKGYVVLENFLETSSVNKINKELKLHRHISKSEANKIIKGDLIDNSASDKSYSGVFYSYLTDQELKQDSEIVQKLVLNNQIKTIVANYFKSTPYLVGLTSFITNPKKIKDFTNLDIHFNAQMYHFDYSHLKFLKVFVFLSDVENEKDGAHCFVEGSHRSFRKYPKEKKYFYDPGLKKIGSNYYGNIKKEWVENNYEQGKIKKFCYPKGTILIEDTYGLHRGSECLTNQRKVLQLYFSISNLSGGWLTDSQPTLAINSEEKYLYPMLQSKKKLHFDVENIYKKKKEKNFKKFCNKIFKFLKS